MKLRRGCVPPCAGERAGCRGSLRIHRKAGRREGFGQRECRERRRRGANSAYGLRDNEGTNRAHSQRAPESPGLQHLRLSNALGPSKAVFGGLCCGVCLRRQERRPAERCRHARGGDYRAIGGMRSARLLIGLLRHDGMPSGHGRRCVRLWGAGVHRLHGDRVRLRWVSLRWRRRCVWIIRWGIDAGWCSGVQSGDLRGMLRGGPLPRRHGERELRLAWACVPTLHRRERDLRRTRGRRDVRRLRHAM
jgi:hypothetical protein